MKLRAPSLIRNIARLSWQGAVTVEDYRRLRVHLWFGGLLLSLLFLAVAVPLGLALMLAKQPTLTTGYMVVAGILFGALTLWWAWQALKVEVLRLRGLGINGWKALTAIIIVFWLALFGSRMADELGNSPELLLTGMVPIEVFRWLSLALFLQIGVALYNFWMYLEETPLRKVTAAVINPIPEAQGRLESGLIFLLQVWVWFEILSIPMYVLVAHLQHS